MRRILAFVLLLTAFSAPALGQDIITPDTPPGWLFGGDVEKYEVGTRVPPERPGTPVAYIKAGPNAQCGDIAALYQTIAADKYRGKRLKFSARMRSGMGIGGVTSSMFMFVSGPGHSSGVDRPRWLGVGARDREFSSYNEYISIGVPANAEEITFGFRVIGPRGASMNAVRLEVVGDDQPAPPRGAPVSKAGSVGNFNSRLTNGLAVHGGCGYQYSTLMARGRYELDERSLTMMARRSAPQGVAAALSE